MKAIAYVRVSGKDQITGDGFDRQEAAINKYAGANGIEIVQVFRELGVSGETEGMDRPAWVDAIVTARRESIETILIEKLDRLARLQGIQEYILLDMKKRGLTVVPVDDPTLCSDDPMRVLFRQIIGAIAQYDKTMIVLKTRAARERIRARDGKCEGRKEFGHFPGEADTLAVIKSCVEEQKTVAAITRELNKKGLAPRKGKKWHQHSVARVIERNAKQCWSVVETRM